MQPTSGSTHLSILRPSAPRWRRRTLNPSSREEWQRLTVARPLLKTCSPPADPGGFRWHSSWYHWVNSEGYATYLPVDRTGITLKRKCATCGGGLRVRKHIPLPFPKFRRFLEIVWSVFVWSAKKCQNVQQSSQSRVHHQGRHVLRKYNTFSKP